MLHKNMRDLFVQDLIFFKASDLQPVEKGKVRIASIVTFAKNPDDTVCVISEDGDAIMSVVKPRTVIVPTVEYEGDEPVQERIMALISSMPEQVRLEATTPGAHQQVSTVPVNQAFSSAKSVHGKRPHAVIADREVAEKLAAHVDTTVWAESPPKVYESPTHIGNDLAYFVSEPEDLGHLVITVPTGKQGLLIHGKVTLLRIGAAESFPTPTES